jgi:hypothetical protein
MIRKLLLIWFEEMYSVDVIEIVFVYVYTVYSQS